jgi:protocatechuate 3,4-dioxygenase alpha subunit
MSLEASAAQTVGPYFRLGLSWLYCVDIPCTDPNASRVTIVGGVYDGDGVAVNDALLEIWQADPAGRYSTETSGHCPMGFGRIATDRNGRYRFTTVVPGQVQDTSGVLQAPHLTIGIFMRGLLKRAATRLYFPERPDNATDPVLTVVPAERRATLIARATAPGVLTWDIHMQGAHETVFFDY